MDIEPECSNLDEKSEPRGRTARRLIEAKVTFLSAGQGGRNHPAKNSSVYRANWVQTIPGKGWNTILRLYGPLQAWFDKTWRPGEIEPMK